MADADDAPAPAKSAPPPLAASPQPLPKAPRVNPPTAAQRREAAEGELGEKAPISLQDILNWARSFDGTSGPSAEPAKLKKSGVQRAVHITRKKRKFHKFDPEAAKAEQLAAEALEREKAEELGELGELGELETEISLEDEDEGDAERAQRVAEDPRKGLRKIKPRPRSLLSSLLVQAVILLLIAGGFILGRVTMPAAALATSKRPAPIPADSDKTPNILSPAAMETIDQAIEADNAGDAKKASLLFDQLRHSSGHVDGLDYRLAWLAFRSGDAPSAMVLLNRSIAEGEEVGGSYGLRGMIANQHGPTRGLHDFEAATQADPFEPTNFFYWGEALRRAGKPQAALVHLREAAERAQTPADQAKYELKVRLTQIELGQEKDFAKQLAAELALPQPPMEWVLTSAAVEMHSGNYAAAAADLVRARQLTTPALLAAALRDYFFIGYSDKPELAALYAEILPKGARAKPSTVTTPSSDFPAVTLTPGIGQAPASSPAPLGR